MDVASVLRNQSQEALLLAAFRKKRQRIVDGVYVAHFYLGLDLYCIVCMGGMEGGWRR